MGIHPQAGHLGSGNNAPFLSPRDPKTLEEMCNEVALLWAAHGDYLQELAQFWDEEIMARIELNLFLQTLAS